MKIQEAISHYNYGIKCDIFSEPVTSYAKLAVEALEKQIPKRPIEDGYYDEPAVCPNCGGNVINQCDNDYQFRHCHYCGQRLDWSDHPTEKGGVQE